MVRKRYTGITNPEAEFQKLDPYRHRLCLMASEYRFGCPEHQALRRAVEALDEAIETITGKRDLL